MNVTNTYLKFKNNSNNEETLVSVAEILNVGHPMENDEELELISEELFNVNGEEIKYHLI